MITSFRDHITEELIAAVKVAELRSGEVPRCGYTSNLAGSTGEDNSPCGSLATGLAIRNAASVDIAKQEEVQVCEFHTAICMMAGWGIAELRGLV